MIKVSSLGVLYDYLARIIYFGKVNNYSNGYIEERISSSFFIEELEKSSDDFLYSDNIDDLIHDIYPFYRGKDYDYSAINPLFLWIGEAYIRLFFKHHKAMEYVFLYIPLIDMINLFDLYHELDWSQLHNYFVSKTKEKTLLSKLIERKGISINKLAQLTNISVNTIAYYCKDDNHMYEAKYSYVNLIALALKVNIRIFLKEVNNYTYSGSYEFDKNNYLYRNYLGLYICSYYSLEVERRNYVYNPDKGLFEYDNGYLLVKSTPSKAIVDEIPVINPDIEMIVVELSKEVGYENRAKTILVIFEHSAISDNVSSYQKLLSYGFESIYIINQKSVLCVSESYWMSTITSEIVDSMTAKAKKAAGGDFAI